MQRPRSPALVTHPQGGPLPGAAPASEFNDSSLAAVFRGIQSTSSHSTWQLYAKLDEYEHADHGLVSDAVDQAHAARVCTKPNITVQPIAGSAAGQWVFRWGFLGRQAGTLAHEWLQSQMDSRPINKVSDLYQLPAATTDTPTAHTVLFP